MVALVPAPLGVCGNVCMLSLLSPLLAAMHYPYMQVLPRTCLIERVVTSMLLLDFLSRLLSLVRHGSTGADRTCSVGSPPGSS